ncbi:MAG: hypothetical protein KJ624_02555 [Chloroflexi bacterium]|nr:hypothetical protein [Chloroflexota bacterium]
MAKYCPNCGRKLSFFSREGLCSECKTTQEVELDEIEQQIEETKSVTEQQLELLKKHDRGALVKLFGRIYEQFEEDKELEEGEIAALQSIQDKLGLSIEEVQFNERIRPYIYVNTIRKEGKLPTVNLRVEGGGQVILKKGEVVHFADTASLKELRSVSLGYSGGSHGISFPIAKGVRYRVGAHRGHIVREDRYVETSRGALMITNQRLFLHPFPGQKPVSIPLDKILSYQCFDNGIEVYKEGREKGYLFTIGSSGSVEIFGLCLGKLSGQ